MTRKTIEVDAINMFKNNCSLLSSIYNKLKDTNWKSIGRATVGRIWQYLPIQFNYFIKLYNVGIYWMCTNIEIVNIKYILLTHLVD